MPGRNGPDIHHVAGEIIGAPTEEVREPHIVKHRGRLVGGDMPADVGMFAGTQHHRHGVPANKRIDARFSGQIAGIRRLLIGRIVFT